MKTIKFKDLALKKEVCAIMCDFRVGTLLVL